MHLILIISIFTRAIQSVSQLHGQTSRGSTATLKQTIFAWKFSRMAFGLLIYIIELTLMFQIQVCVLMFGECKVPEI